MPGTGLPQDRLGLAMQRITAWRADPDAAVACPVCEVQGLVIVDHSARPHAEWYALSCKACGLEATTNVPLGPPAMVGLD